MCCCVEQLYEFDIAFITNSITTQLPGRFRAPMFALPQHMGSLRTCISRWLPSIPREDVTPTKDEADHHAEPFVWRRAQDRPAFLADRDAAVHRAAASARAAVVFTGSETAGGFGDVGATPSSTRRKTRCSPYLAHLPLATRSEVESMLRGHAPASGASPPAASLAAPAPASDGRGAAPVVVPQESVTEEGEEQDMHDLSTLYAHCITTGRRGAGHVRHPHHVCADYVVDQVRQGRSVAHVIQSPV